MTKLIADASDSVYEFVHLVHAESISVTLCALRKGHLAIERRKFFTCREWHRAVLWRY